MIRIQDGKGNMLINKTFQARFNQLNCVHNYIEMGKVKACTKCLKLKINE